jgi:triacylglycerol lipase
MFLPPGFDRSIAREAAGLVNQAYDQYVKFKQGAAWSLDGTYDLLGPLSARPPGPLAQVEPFGFVARNTASGNVFVTFRGTQSIEDWVSNVSFPQVAHPWAGHTEKGFTDLYNQCTAKVKAAVQSAPGAPNVFVTGHSLGGALATLATADLTSSGVRAAMYNIASPRVGDRAFAARFDSQVAVRWRIVNTEDIVTTVPIATPELESPAHELSPLGLFLRLANHLTYEHVGDAVTFTKNKGTILGNHQMPTYVEALQGP